MWLIWFSCSGKVLATLCNPFFPLGSINCCNINHKLPVLDQTSLKNSIKLNKYGSLLTLRHSLCVRLSLSVHMAGTQALYSYLSMTITFLTYRSHICRCSLIPNIYVSHISPWTWQPHSHDTIFFDYWMRQWDMAIGKAALFIQQSSNTDYIVQWTRGEYGVHFLPCLRNWLWKYTLPHLLVSV